jgi:hypothetical protein
MDALFTTLVAWGERAWTFVFGADTFWSAFFATGLGALLAFELERRHRRYERASEERAKANRLLSTLGFMVSSLEDLKQSLFDEQDAKHGGEADWTKIGPLPGTPTKGPEIAFNEFDFLLETDDPNETAPRVFEIMSRAEREMNTMFSLVNERSDLFYELQDKHSVAQFALGEQGAAAQAGVNSLARHVKGLTTNLRKDLPECIDTFKRAINELQTLLAVRYPGKKLIDPLRPAKPGPRP